MVISKNKPRNKYSWEEIIGDWYEFDEIKEFFDGRYIYSLMKFLSQEYNSKVIYPNYQDVFRPFRLCSPKETKVIIITMEPFADGTSNGLGLGQKSNTVLQSPASHSILYAAERDLRTVDVNFDLTLESWAKQGVLLLNRTLTVEKHNPGSHKKQWEHFVPHLLYCMMYELCAASVFLWGDELLKLKTINGENLDDAFYVFEGQDPVSCCELREQFVFPYFTTANQLITEKKTRAYSKETIKWLNN